MKAMVSVYRLALDLHVSDDAKKDIIPTDSLQTFGCMTNGNMSQKCQDGHM
jgi:hypothetical protein